MNKSNNFSYTFLSSSILSAALLSSSIAVAKQEEHREHGAHEHGHAQLSVVVEKNQLLVSIESPAINVFGFEHQPNNHEQTTIAEKAVEDLENFSSLITLDANAKCSVRKVDVNHPFELRHDNHPHGDEDHKDEHKHDEHKNEHAEHKDEHKHDEHKDKHAEHKDEHKHDEHKNDHAEHKDEHKHDEHKDEHAEHKDEHKHDEHKDEHDDHKETHSDVDIEVAYVCEHGEKLTKIDLSPLFKRFTLFEELDAQAIINGKQSASELSKDQAVLSLKK